MITRKAILLRFAENLHEDLRINRDFELVKTFLKSAPGGCFEEDEIIELKTNEIENEQELFKLIDTVDFSFIYFSGHSDHFDRKVQLPLKNIYMRAIDLQRNNTKQWLFFDTCRTSHERIKSPEFYFERDAIHFPECNEKAYQHWIKWVNELPQDSCATYYTTEIGKYAFTNEQGGYGTQLFFTTLSQVLQNKEKTNLEEIVSIINEQKGVIQNGTLFNISSEKIIFRNSYPFVE